MIDPDAPTEAEVRDQLKARILSQLGGLSVDDLEAICDVTLDAIAKGHGILRRNIDGTLERLDPSTVLFEFKLGLKR